MLRLLLAFLTLVCTFALAADGRNGMVSSAHPIATQAGLDVLKKGGNAFDAAVAVAATLNVVEPEMSGIGGYGTILYYDAKAGKTVFLNPSGRIPQRVNSDVFRAPTLNYEQNRFTVKAISTPGNLNAWWELAKKGKLKWDTLFTSAIQAAERGFPMSERARVLAGDVKDLPLYTRDGKPLPPGELIKQPELAGSLRLIAAQGPKVFYEGELGKAIIAAVEADGGFLGLGDLQQNQAETWEPIAIDYHGYKVMTAAPPANSFDMLVRVGMMGELGSGQLEHNGVEYLHRFAEVTKHGFWVRLNHAGDPDVAPPPVKKLLAKEYFVAEAAKIDHQRASRFEYPGAKQAQHTTHFVVADRWGNVVSATQTLGGLFGSRLRVRGIWLNNSLSYSTFEPKGNPMDAVGGRRKLSGDCPVIIFRNGRPWAALGTPGGHTIGQTVAQMVLNLVDYKMNIEQAIAAPRVSFLEPDELGIERALPQSVKDGLAARGHKLDEFRGFGNAHGLTIERDANGNITRFRGAADPRGQGLAAGY